MLLAFSIALDRCAYSYAFQKRLALTCIERFGRLIAEAVLKFQQKRIESFLFDTAEARYLEFIKENPGLFNRVSLSHLSSYLGIERQTLTRIRQKLARS